MRSNSFILLMVVGLTINLPNISLFASSKTEKHGDYKLYCTIRLGQGGFSDSRSPIGKLGGGQLVLDIKPAKLPLAISWFTEYYTNCPDPSHSYEIANLNALNILYLPGFLKNKKLNPFIGAGIGILEVPIDGTDPIEMETGRVYNLELGINYRAFRYIGFYGIGKYLYANKKSAGVAVIDFNEFIVLLGITANFGLFNKS